MRRSLLATLLLTSACSVTPRPYPEIFEHRTGPIMVELPPEATPTATELVSMWQTNSVAFRLTRYLNWSAQAGAVRVISGAAYGSVVS